MKIVKIKEKPERTFKEELVLSRLKTCNKRHIHLKCESNLARNMRDGRYLYETFEDRTPQNIDAYLQRVAKEFQHESRNTDHRNVFGGVVADYFGFWQAMTDKPKVRYLDALRFVKDLRKLENRTRSRLKSNAYNRFQTIAFFTGFGDCALDNGDLETAVKAYETAGVARTKHVDRRLRKYGLELSS